MAVKAYFNAQGCRNKGGFKLMLHVNRKKAAPMFQFAFLAVLFQFRARKPQLRPLLQFPNRRQTPPGDAVPIPLYFVVYNLRCFKAPVSPGGVLRAPRPPYTATPTGGKRRSAAPMLQFACLAGLSQVRARKPQARPS